MQLQVQTHQEITIPVFKIMEDMKFDQETQQFATETLPRILIVAKSQAGKSWLIKELLY